MVDLKEIITYFTIFFILTVVIFGSVSGIIENSGNNKIADQSNKGNNETVNKNNYIIDVDQEDINFLARAVYSEARGESLEGQVAVAAVIINRVKNSKFPGTVRKVIFQPWAFTAVHDGQFWLKPDNEAYKAVEYALKGWDPSEGALFYYNPAKVTSDWIYSRPVIGEIGQHVFAQ